MAALKRLSEMLARRTRAWLGRLPTPAGLLGAWGLRGPLNLRESWHRLQSRFGRQPRPAGARPAGAPLQQWLSVAARDGRLGFAPWLTPSRDVLILRAHRGEPDRVLVWLHGCRQDPLGFAQATRVQRLLDSGRWLIVLPAQSRLANAQRCWNWFDRPTARGGGEAAIVLAALDQALAGLPDGAKGVFIAGMSSGAALAAACVCAAPHRFTAAAFHSGVAAGAASGMMRARQVLKHGPDRDVGAVVRAKAPVAAMIIHGTDDEVVVPGHARALLRQMMVVEGSLTADADPGEPLRTVVVGEGARQASIAEFGPHRLVAITGLGHAWSGGDDAWPFNEADAPDATALIEAFFEQALAARRGR